MTSVVVDDGFGDVFCAAKAGDPPAVSAVVDEFFAPVERYLARRGASDAESLANQVLHQAIVRGDPQRISNRPTFRGFLFAVARNRVADDLRSQARRVTIDLVEDPVQLRGAAVLQAPAAESIVLDAIGVHELLEQVKPDQAEVLRLRLLEGETLESTASILGKSVPAVTSLHYRGLAQLRRVVMAAMIVVLIVAGGWVVNRDGGEVPVISDDTGVPEPAPVERPAPDGLGRPVTPPAPDVPRAKSKSGNDSSVEHSMPAVGTDGVDAPWTEDEPAPALEVAPSTAASGDGTSSIAGIEPEVVEVVVTTPAVAVEVLSSDTTGVDSTATTSGRGVAPAPAKGIALSAGCAKGGKKPERSATCAADLAEVIASRGRAGGGT